MGNNNSRSGKNKRSGRTTSRRTRNQKGASQVKPQQDQQFYTVNEAPVLGQKQEALEDPAFVQQLGGQPALEARAPEQKQGAQRMNRARSNLLRVKVDKWDVQNPGFLVEKVSLMILDVIDVTLRQAKLPEGSIIREVNGVQVYDYTQFSNHVQNKTRYILSVLVPEMTGTWKVRPNSQNRHVEVHPESLVVVSTNLPTFPPNPQIVRYVNGVSVRNYGEYRLRTKSKSKFFITVASADMDHLSPISITTHLQTLNRYPHNISENEKNFMRQTIEHAITEIKNELNIRAQVIPPRQGEVLAPKYPPPIPGAVFSQTHVPDDRHNEQVAFPIQQAAIANDVPNQEVYEEEKQPKRRRGKRKKKRRKKRNR